MSLICELFYESQDLVRASDEEVIATAKDKIEKYKNYISRLPILAPVEDIPMKSTTWLSVH
ncbi:hypothetical protein [Sphingobacterium sp. E70]|uniref:hypothetical protein n=1 Tax=Sphingobacterium sp. E70 TaxID=2853439 RepID=UPI002795E824|nr:hypothetical protein [Sphingobacterium sp. E70]